MDADAGLLINAVVSGLLLGGFYAAVSVGVAISFGMLDIVNIAHPAFILLGSYAAFIGNTVFGIDPILATVITLPVFYLLGMLAYQVYYVAFERRDDDRHDRVGDLLPRSADPDRAGLKPAISSAGSSAA